MIEKFGSVLSDIKRNENIRSVILTGWGERIFSTGDDVSLFSDYSAEKMQRHYIELHERYRMIERLGKPVICAVNGHAVGGGLELAIACTLKIASDKAEFWFPEISLGISPCIQRLPKLIGKTRALEMLLTGRRYSAKEAQQIGLINKVVKPSIVLDESKQLASALAENSTINMRMIMESVNIGFDIPIEAGSLIDSGLGSVCIASEDGREGMKAFTEKRKPKFKGK